MKDMAAKRLVKRLVKQSTEPEQDSGVVCAEIPEYSWYERYVSRDIDGVPDLDILTYALEECDNVLIEGPTGAAKTSFCMAFAALHKKRFYSVPTSSGLEASVLFGKFLPNGGWHWVDGPVTDIVRNGGVLLLNEYNFFPERVAPVLFGLTDMRREIKLLDHEGETIRAHRPTRKDARGKVLDHCWCDSPSGPACREKWVLIIADMNPGYQGTRPLNAANRDRFNVILWWDYDATVEANLVQSKSLRTMAGLIRADVDSGKYRTPVTTRMLQDFERHLIRRTPEFASMNFVNKFDRTERSSIRQVVSTHMKNIVTEIKVINTDGKPPKFADMTDEEIETWRLNLKPGEVDPEWGVYIKDWVWGDEDEDKSSDIEESA